MVSSHVCVCQLAPEVEPGVGGGREERLEGHQVQLLDGRVHREALGQHELGVDPVHLRAL